MIDIYTKKMEEIHDPLQALIYKLWKNKKRYYHQ